MDQATELIVTVHAQEYNILRFTTNKGNSYEADLSHFKQVYCYPTVDEWKKVNIDSYGIDLVWPGRFEIQIDQILAIAKELSR